MAGKKGEKKRFWSEDEKRSICSQTRAPGVSVAQVARRYAMNANLIHKWLRDPRFNPVEETGLALDANEAAFLPVEIEERPLVLSQQMHHPLLTPRCWYSAWTSHYPTDGAFWWKATLRCRRFWPWSKG